jgi:hypothetical protein
MNLSGWFLATIIDSSVPSTDRSPFSLTSLILVVVFIQLSSHVIFYHRYLQGHLQAYKVANLMSSHSLITVYLLYPLEQLQSPSILTETCVPSPSILRSKISSIRPSYHPLPVHWISICRCEIHPLKCIHMPSPSN